jgi:hypothetical protein
MRLITEKQHIYNTVTDNLSHSSDLRPYILAEAQLYPIHSAVLSKNPIVVKDLLLLISAVGPELVKNTIDKRFILITRKARGKNVNYGKTARGLVEIMIKGEKDKTVLENLKIIKCLLIKAGAKPKYADSTFKSVAKENRKLVNNTRNAHYNCFRQSAGRMTRRRYREVL